MRGKKNIVNLVCLFVDAFNSRTECRICSWHALLATAAVLQSSMHRTVIVLHDQFSEIYGTCLTKRETSRLEKDSPLLGTLTSTLLCI